MPYSLDVHDLRVTTATIVHAGRKIQYCPIVHFICQAARASELHLAELRVASTSAHNRKEVDPRRSVSYSAKRPHPVLELHLPEDVGVLFFGIAQVVQ